MLVLGGVGVDTIVRVPDLTLPPGDGVGVPPIIDYVAHSGNGVALGFHALGLRTAFVDFLGDDLLGDFVLARYAAVGLDFTRVPSAYGTPRSVNLVDEAGRRFSFFDGRYPPDLKLPRDSYLPLLQRARHAHIAGPRAFDAYADVHRLDVTTSTDIHAWDGSHEPTLTWAREADLVFLSAEGAPDTIDDLMHTILTAGRATTVVATEGAAGCRVLTRASPTVRRFPATVPDRPVIDSNGAGDAFSTAFMTRWLHGQPVEDCVLAGTVAGAFACGAAGTHEELITEAQLTARLTRSRAAA